MSAEDLRLRQGVPFSGGFRFHGAALTWPAAVGCEARAQARKWAGGPLLADLGPWLTLSAQGDDIVVDLDMPGHATRAMPTRAGVYDLVLSDKGDTDSRALSVSGTIRVAPAVTTADAVPATRLGELVLDGGGAGDQQPDLVIDGGGA